MRIYLNEILYMLKLARPQRVLIRGIQDRYLGKNIELGISTNEGLKTVGGRLQVLTYPFQVFISGVEQEIFEELFLPKREAFANNGKFGLRLAEKFGISQHLENTLRAYFTGLEHGILTINLDGKKVFQNEYIKVPYQTLTNLRKINSFRESMRFPLISGD